VEGLTLGLTLTTTLVPLDQIARFLLFNTNTISRV